MKTLKKSTIDAYNAILDYVMAEVGRRGENWNGKYDMRPVIELIGERKFNDVYNAAAKRLLEQGFHQVSLDQVNKALILG